MLVFAGSQSWRHFLITYLQSDNIFTTNCNFFGLVKLSFKPLTTVLLMTQFKWDQKIICLLPKITAHIFQKFGPMVVHWRRRDLLSIILLFNQHLYTPHLSGRWIMFIFLLSIQYIKVVLTALPYDDEDRHPTGHMKEPKSRVPAVTSAHCGCVRRA